LSENKEAQDVQQEETVDVQEVHEAVLEPESVELEKDKSPQAELDQKQEELDQLQDKFLRTCAELDNLRKRNQRDVTEARKYAVEKFAASLLGVGDNLERALEVDAQDAAAIREGIELTLKTWTDRLEQNGIKRVDAIGKVFDPHMHAALAQKRSEEDEGIVVAQHAAGYTLNERLLRPAQVMVSSGKA